MVDNGAIGEEMRGCFTGKAALVTGAGAGIGRAIALRLAEDGAAVFAVGRGESVAATASLHSNIASFVADVGDEASVAAAFAACRDRVGVPTIVCNNVGISIVEGRLHETKLETFDKVWAVNIRGAMHVLQLAIGGMLEVGGGAIVNMASIGSFRASPTSGAYIISKGAMLMMTRQAAIEYAKDNIRVNSVHPGLIATDMIKQRDPALLQSKVDATPMGRMGTPEEVAALTAFLCSDEASYVTGAAYMADGGRSAG
jgi:NAD(P)-dependent dehydrogenase (short-subunit alcohol dehydrogenase family)